ncbi:MAG: hypothetical protein OHK0012_07590 [Synechococcales cyanobacterium]
MMQNISSFLVKIHNEYRCYSQETVHNSHHLSVCMKKPPTLEEYLLDAGILNGKQLAVAQRLQQRQQGPLLMILLQLSFISVEQLDNLMNLDFTPSLFY